MKRFKNGMKQGLALLMATAVLSGCGGDNGGSENGNSNENTQDSTTTTDTESSVEDEVVATHFMDDIWEAKDLGGREIIISNHWHNYPLNGDEYNPSTYNELDKMIGENLLRVEEKYNTTVTGLVTTWDELLPQFQTSVLAGDPYADLVWLQGPDALSAAINGQLQPISSFADPSDDIFNEQKYLKPVLEVNGEYYGMQVAELEFGAEFFGYNIRIIEELGLEDPQELYYRGEWTWDKFLEYAKLGTYDKDGDGKTDVYGLSGPISNIFNGFIASNDGYWVNTDFELGVQDEKTVKAIQFASDLWNKENVVFVPDTDIWDWDASVSAFKNDNVLFWWGAAWMHYDAGIENLDYGLVPFPVGPDSDKPYWFTNIEGNSGTFYMPVGVENPEDVYKVYTEFRSWFEDEELSQEGAVIWLESCFKREEDVQLLIDISTNNKKQDANTVITGFDSGAIFGPVALGDKTVAQAIEENKQTLQNAITTSISVD